VGLYPSGSYDNLVHKHLKRAFLKLNRDFLSATLCSLAISNVDLNIPVFSSNYIVRF